MTKYIEKKEIWTMLDRDGNEMKTLELDGWDNDIVVETEFDETKLITDSDNYGEGEFFWNTISTTHNDLLYEEITDITYNDNFVGCIVYERTCELDDM